MVDLKDPEEDLYYCMLTLAGDDDASDARRASNRRYWEMWLSTDDRGRANVSQFNHRSFKGLPSENDLRDLHATFRRRTRGNLGSLPVPGATPEISRVRFERDLDLSRYAFPFGLKLTGCRVGGRLDLSGSHAVGQVVIDSTELRRGLTAENAIFEVLLVSASNVRSGVAILSSQVNALRCSNLSVNTLTHLHGHFQEISFVNSDLGSCEIAFSSESFAPSLRLIRSKVKDFRCPGPRLGSIEIAEVEFGDYASFAPCRFSGEVLFHKCSFAGEAVFRGASFEGLTSFEASRFERVPPDFRDCKLVEATEFFDVVWPSPPEDLADARRSLAAYERLKQEMERLKKHEDEQIFFRRELRVKRVMYPWTTPSGLVSRALNWLYQVTSNYGASASLPLLWLVGIWVAGAVTFANVHVFAGEPLSWGNAAAVSFANIFPFLPLRSDIMEIFDPGQAYGILHAVAAVQAIGAAFMLFLFGLALRSRFRMR